MNEKVSVIIPVYNIEEYVERCLMSVVNQTYYNLEIIVVNDGSKDNSLEICEKISRSDKRIQIITQPNGGLSAARNTGLKNASGKYVMFVDGDDWIDLHCIESAVSNIADSDIFIFSFVREYKNKTVPTQIFDNDYLEFKGETLNGLVRRLVGPISNEMKRPHKIEDLNPAWNKLYKTDLIKEIKFVNTKEIGTEDLWYNILAFSKSKKIIFKNVLLYHYNKENENSLTRKFNEFLLPRWKTLYKYIREYISQANFQDDIYYKALNNRIVINLLALSRNIVNSNLSKNRKYNELKKLLSDELYVGAFDKFEFYTLPMHWNFFIKLVKKRTFYEFTYF